MSSRYSQTGFWSNLLIRSSDETLRITIDLAQVQSKKTESTIAHWIKAQLKEFSERRQVEGVSLLSEVENFTINGKRITELLPKFPKLVRIIQEGLYAVACVKEMVITTSAYLMVLALMISSEGLNLEEFTAPFKRELNSRDEDANTPTEVKYWGKIIKILFDNPIVKGLLVFAAIVIAVPVIIYATWCVFGITASWFSWMYANPFITSLGIIVAAGAYAIRSKSDEAARRTRRTRPLGTDESEEAARRTRRTRPLGTDESAEAARHTRRLDEIDD